MEILVKPFLLDVIIVFFIMIMMILGYKKGFIVRLYDFVTTVLTCLAAYIASYPVSRSWTIYSLQPPLEEVGDKVNQLVVFVILFVVLKLICRILGIFVKPMLKNMFSAFKITRFADHSLGAALSLLESMILIYIVLVVIVSPLFSGGQEIIEQSVIGKSVTDHVPVYTEKMMALDMIEEYRYLDLDRKDTACVTIVSDVLFQLDDLGLIDEDTLKTFMINYYSDIDQVSVDQGTYERLLAFCQKHEIDDQKITKGLIVSEKNEE